MKIYGSKSRSHLIAASILGLVFCLCVPQANAGNGDGGDVACSINDGSINFGTYDLLSPIETESTGGPIQITCNDSSPGGGGGSSSVNYTITMSTGQSNSYSPRQMTNANGSTLSYNLYTNPSRVQIWGDGNGGTRKITGGGPCNSANNCKHTVYGTVPASQTNITPGLYQDLIVITVSFD